MFFILAASSIKCLGISCQMYFMMMFSSSYVDVLFISQNFDRHLLERIARNGVLISEKFQHSVRSSRSVRPPQRRDRHSKLGDKRHQFKFAYLKLFQALHRFNFRAGMSDMSTDMVSASYHKGKLSISCESCQFVVSKTPQTLACQLGRRQPSGGG